MQSRLISRALLVLLAVTLAAGAVACFSTGGRSREAALTRSLQELLPGGRVYPNDLASERQLAVITAHLYEAELVLQDAHGRLTCLDRRNLAPKWYYTGLPGPMEHAPGMGPDALVAISGGALFVVDRFHGNQLGGGMPLDVVPSAGPSATDSTAFVPSLAAAEGYRTLVTVNRLTGLEGWGLATRGSISAAPVMGGSAARPILYFATEGKRIFAYAAESSLSGAPDPTWSHHTHGRVVSSPVLADDLLLVASEGGDLWVLSRVTGVEHWVHYAGKAITRSPWAAGDQVYFTNEDGFFALDRESGALEWTFASPADFVVRRADGVYVRTEDGTVHALDAETGKVLRANGFDAKAMFPANMMDGILYMVTRSGLVLAVDVPLE